MMIFTTVVINCQRPKKYFQLLHFLFFLMRNMHDRFRTQIVHNTKEETTKDKIQIVDLCWLFSSWSETSQCNKKKWYWILDKKCKGDGREGVYCILKMQRNSYRPTDPIGIVKSVKKMRNNGEAWFMMFVLQADIYMIRIHARIY